MFKKWADETSWGRVGIALALIIIIYITFVCLCDVTKSKSFTDLFGLKNEHEQMTEATKDNNPFHDPIRHRDVRSDRFPFPQSHVSQPPPQHHVHFGDNSFINPQQQQQQQQQYPPQYGGSGEFDHFGNGQQSYPIVGGGGGGGNPDYQLDYYSGAMTPSMQNQPMHPGYAQHDQY